MINTQIKCNPAFNCKRMKKRQEVQVLDLQKGEKMKPGKMKRCDRSVRDKRRWGGVVVSMSGYVIIV